MMCWGTLRGMSQAFVGAGIDGPCLTAIQQSGNAHFLIDCHFSVSVEIVVIEDSFLQLAKEG